MTDDDNGEIEIKLGSRWGKMLAAGLAGTILGGSGGGAVGTWLAPQAAAADIAKAATDAAQAAVAHEREVTDAKFRTVDAKLDAQKAQLDRVEIQNDKQDNKLDRIYEAVKK